jgi:hypothetical protein
MVIVLIAALVLGLVVCCGGLAFLGLALPYQDLQQVQPMPVQQLPAPAAPPAPSPVAPAPAPPTPESAATPPGGG